MHTYVGSTVRKHVVPRLFNVEAMTSWTNRLSFWALLRPHGQLVISLVFGGSVRSNLIHFAHIGYNEKEYVKQPTLVGKSNN